MDFYLIKALHIVFVVTWFSGMFYLGRLLVYSREANDFEPVKKDIIQQQLLLMTKRLLFAIAWPSAILTACLGTYLASYFYPFSNWLLLKLFLVLLLLLYQWSLHLVFLKHKQGVFNFTSKQLRAWNEVPSLFLIFIVTLVVTKSLILPVYLTLGFVAFGLLVFLVYKLYKS
jgi:putative membrane protein